MLLPHFLIINLVHTSKNSQGAFLPLLDFSLTFGASGDAPPFRRPPRGADQGLSPWTPCKKPNRSVGAGLASASLRPLSVSRELSVIVIFMQAQAAPTSAAVFVSR